MGDARRATGTGGRRLPPALLALTPGELEPDDGAARAALLARVEAAAAAGLRGVLLREPALFDREVLELARELRERLDGGAWIGIHDRVYLAADPVFDGVQLGWSSIAPHEARALDWAATEREAPPCVGFSAHAGDRLQARGGADFLLLAPVHATASHPDPSAPDFRPPLGPDGLRRELERDGRPTWALGGIEASRARGLSGLSLRGVAVRGAVLGAPSPGDAADATRALLEALASFEEGRA